MANNAARRPLPALISLAALLLLTALVWWRVINRDNGSDADAQAGHCSTATASASPTAAPTTTLPARSTVRVLVLNATSRTGIAGKARTALIADGFPSPGVAANFEGKATITGVGEIRFPAASRSAAQLVGYYVPGAKLVVTKTKKKSVPVTVVLGPRYKAVLSASAGEAAMARQRATVSPAPAAPGASTSPSPSPKPTKTHC